MKMMNTFMTYLFFKKINNDMHNKVVHLGIATKTKLTSKVSGGPKLKKKKKKNWGIKRLNLKKKKIKN
jgi:hypothetical protein